MSNDDEMSSAPAAHESRKSRTRRWRWGLAALVVLVALIALAQRGRRTAMAGSYISTLMGVQFDMPHPWPRGNYFSVRPRWKELQERYARWMNKYLEMEPGWQVVNMYSENFSAICQQEGITWVKVERLDRGLCAIVDSRIPRSWLSDRPLRMGIPESRELRLNRPDLFSSNPEAEALVGTTWAVLEREDPDGHLARVLPGHKIGFQAVDLRCLPADGGAAAMRTWTLEKLVRPSRNRQSADAETTLSLGVYDLHGETYEGITGELLVDGREMQFTLGGTVECDGRSVAMKGYRVRGKDAWVRFVRDEAGAN